MKARLPGGARTRITSLAVLARADFEQPTDPLLPTPGAADHKRGADYWKDERGSGGDDLLTTVSRLMPTPQARDHKGRNQRDDASCLPGAINLLPTPTSTYRGDRSESSKAKGGGNELRAIRKLLPTPTANEKNPGAGGELRAALTHGPSRRNETGIDSFGRPNLGRPAKLLPTPTANDSEQAGSRNLEGSKAHPGVSLTDAIRFGDSNTPRSESSGENTPQPSTDGNESSEGPLPGQLTIEDVSNPDSWSG
jgi:hypothetical protein